MALPEQGKQEHALSGVAYAHGSRLRPVPVDTNLLLNEFYAAPGNAPAVLEIQPMTVGRVEFGPKIGPPEWPTLGFPTRVGAQVAASSSIVLEPIPTPPAGGSVLGKYKRFVPIAQAFADMSKFPGTHVGCVILGEGFQVLSSGWNGAPRGSKADVDERSLTRESRYPWSCHAETNAIVNAARSGTALMGGTLIATLMPCMTCAKAIVQAGIVRVMCPEPIDDSAHWHAEFMLTRTLFAECGVDLVYYDTLGDQE